MDLERIRLTPATATLAAWTALSLAVRHLALRWAFGRAPAGPEPEGGRPLDPYELAYLTGWPHGPSDTRPRSVLSTAAATLLARGA